MKLCLKLKTLIFILLIISKFENHQLQFENEKQTALKKLYDKEGVLIDNRLLSLSTTKSKNCLMIDETTSDLNNLEVKFNNKIEQNK